MCPFIDLIEPSTYFWIWDSKKRESFDLPYCLWAIGDLIKLMATLIKLMAACVQEDDLPVDPFLFKWK